jgi:hypothetical protein
MSATKTTTAPELAPATLSLRIGMELLTDRRVHVTVVGFGTHRTGAGVVFLRDDRRRRSCVLVAEASTWQVCRPHPLARTA